MHRGIKTSIVLVIALSLFGIGCADSGSEPVDDPILDDLDVLMDGVPDKADLVDEKTDQIPPAQFDLVEFQSPVKSQGSRGVCSIFGTVALAEHLFILEGTHKDIDLSEQYLQWSVKFQVGSFPNTSGSNAYSNLRAMSEYGIVTEEMWPYETYKWTSSNDAECDGSNSQPTKCYTNGSPPQAAIDAQKWKLPSGRYISANRNSIKAFMVNKGQAVQVGGTFFYQSWNHGRSALPVSSEYKRKGYVLSPNAEDKTKSLEKRAGHSFILVGWDDDLEVQKRDKDGNGVVDADGNPVNEKGFFLFKNSWGTGSFGTENPKGDGYGWIAMDYVEDHLSARAADEPKVDPPVEICGDEKDNDNDGDTDCDDSDCATEPQCQTQEEVFENNTPVDIPDNNATGITSTIDVSETCPIASLALTVDITHTYRGDIEIRLEHPDGTERQILEPSMEAIDDIKETFVEERFNGKTADGTWTLTIIDSANMDTGTLNSWGLKFTCGDPIILGDDAAFFSEYVEGSSYNKALEIYNAGDELINLENCKVITYNNGASSPSSTIDLAPTNLAAGEVHVLCSSQWGGSDVCDQMSGSINFNGDDALELVCNGDTMDVIGKIGERMVWGSDVSTQNQTLRRKCSITEGDTNGADSFSPATEFDGFAIDTFDGLGSHCQ
jgi:subtilisin-like proprotein convertase family protein